jgi:hypothetical protein
MGARIPLTKMDSSQYARRPHGDKRQFRGARRSGELRTTARGRASKARLSIAPRGRRRVFPLDFACANDENAAATILDQPRGVTALRDRLATHGTQHP